MSTRGLFGIRKAGETKGMYNHYDSYPEGFGKALLKRMCQNKKAFILMYDALKAVPNLDEVPDHDCYKIANAVDAFNYSFDDDTEPYYYEESTSFITDSLFCEYAYIIDLDTEMLEFYVGFQKEPQHGNPYGTKPNGSGYYPCKGMFKVPLSRITNDTIAKIVEHMVDVSKED